jgi:beta-glucosidase
MNLLRYCGFTSAILCAATLSFGQSGDFATSGRVVDSKGNPIVGATVTYTSLAKRLSWDFSNGYGKFGLDKDPIIERRSPTPSLSLPLTGDVTVDLFDPSGKKVASVFSGKLEKGSYSFNLPASLSARLSRSLYVLRIRSANQVIYHKMVNAGGYQPSLAVFSSTQQNSSTTIAKKFVAIDSVRVGKTGYKAKTVAIDAYSSKVADIALDTVKIEELTNTLFGSLSQAEKVGQLIQVDCPGSGSVTSSVLGTIFGGGSDGPGDGAGNPTQWAEFANDYQSASQKTAKKIPILIGFDVVHGFGKCNGATVIPHNIGLGCTFDTLAVQKCHRVAGLEARACGVNFIFGPCIAVPRDDRWGRVYEGFSETPELTAAMARASVIGCQTSDLSHPLAVATCVKHFAGDGGTKWGTGVGEMCDRGNTTGDEASLRTIHLTGYSAAVKAGATSVMASFSSWNGTRCHENKALLTDWLKKDQGFDGFVNGDWNGHTTGTAGSANCFKNGLDVPMIAATASGIGPMQGVLNGLYSDGNGARVDDAVKRLLRVKYRMDLFNSALTTTPAVTATVGSQAHRDMAREGVRKSLVLLKTTAGLLPLEKTKKITLVGKHAQSVGLLCGGWTLGWQGSENANVQGGTNIQKGFERVGGAANINYSADGNTISGEIAVVCIGEQPYAEWEGDRADLAIPGADLVANAKKSGKKVICVMITGRPMDISAIVDKCDALVAAWLPGSEGDGIAEVLYGDKGYKFTGKLSMSIPMNTAQEPINFGDANYAPRYEYDFGLGFDGKPLAKGINTNN